MGAGLNRLVFQPPPPSYSNDSNLLWLTTSQNQTIPAFHIFTCRRSLTILFSHGNAEDLGSIVTFLEEASHAWNVNVFAYEYTGYGLSTGKPTETNVYADAEAAYTYLVDQFHTPASSIVLYGRSLGSAPSIHLAVKYPVKGLIVQSGILSIHRVGINSRISLPGDMFCNIDKIPNVQCPVFFIHGVRDHIVPVSHSVELYNACSQAVKPYWVEGAGHNNIELIGGTMFLQNVKNFLQHINTQPCQRPLVTKKKLKSKRRIDCLCLMPVATGTSS